MLLVKGVVLNVFENMKHNHKLDGFIFKQIAGIRFQECWTNCEQRLSCKSINYQRRFHLCTLNSENDETRLTEGLGFVFKAKTGQNYVQVANTKNILFTIATLFSYSLACTPRFISVVYFEIRTNQ